MEELNMGEAAKTANTPAGNDIANVKKLTVLLVEDNDDFRFYLKDNLRQYFDIVEAANGKEGWQKALARHPDLIVSDIYMPEMNGITLCKKINADSRTKKIPVILLTAIVDEEQQLKGLETGATDYIAKPFNFEILLRKIRNILLHEETLKNMYQKQVDIKPSAAEAVSPDVGFMQRAVVIIEKNLDNPDFSVKELSEGLFMGRVTVYKKIFSLTGKTPLEYIRSVRLQIAAELLQKNGFTVAEVAYQVGFNNPKYFSKQFKAIYGRLPSEYAAENRKLRGQKEAALD
jgi:YesN/AraC family two-component response regulator